MPESEKMEEKKRINFANVGSIVVSIDGRPQSGITVVLESQDTSVQPICVQTSMEGKLPIIHDLSQGNYMMTILYGDHVERQPIFIGQPIWSAYDIQQGASITGQKTSD